MIRGLILFSNVILALIMNVIFGEGVKVTQNSPDRVDPGSEFIVELVINKTDVSGFAKIVQELPEGFMAEAIETQGASFTYNDNKVKLIWMALPESDDFSIKYKVIVSKDVEGEQSIGGQFSYLYNNERKTVELPINKIMVGEEEEEIVEAPSEPAAEETIAEAVPTEENEIAEDIVSQPVIEETLPEPEVSGERKVTDLGNGTFKIELFINKSGIEGFAKVQEQLPEGVTTANGGETKTSVFSFVDQQAKFVWMSVPSEDPIYITYTVKGNITAEDLRNMDGTFAYLFNEETRKAKIKASADQPEPVTPEPVAKEIEEETEPVAEATPEEEPEVEETKPEPTPEPEPEPVVEEKTPEPEPTPEPTTSIPTHETGVTYKVQICAGHNPVDVNPYFKSAFQFEEGPIMTENHEGWIKYTIGGFDQYTTAKDRRNVVTAGYELPGPFVTAYNDGNRITVQEALMITNQKWIQ